MLLNTKAEVANIRATKGPFGIKHVATGYKTRHGVGGTDVYAVMGREVMLMKQSVTISVPVPEEILLSLRVETMEFASQMKTLTALKLCENHKLSIGQSAALAGMNEADFIKVLGQNKVSIFGSGSEIAEDFRNA